METDGDLYYQFWSIIIFCNTQNKQTLLQLWQEEVILPKYSTESISQWDLIL